MAGDNGGGKYISLHRVLHLPNTEEPFVTAKVSPHSEPQESPQPLVAPSGRAEEGPN